MGRYVSVQAYGDNNPKVVQVPYEQATGGREAPVSGSRERLKVEKVENVMGSTAGAGSGEFHTYRAHRRLELFRVENMEKKAKEEEEQAIFEAKVAQKRKETEERAQKNAEKRKRKKMKKMKAKAGGATSSNVGQDGGQSNSEEDVQDGKPSVYKVPLVVKDDGSFLETMKAVLASKAASGAAAPSEARGGQSS